MTNPWRCPHDGLEVTRGAWRTMRVRCRDNRARFEGVRCGNGHPLVIEEDREGRAVVRALSFVPPGPVAPAAPRIEAAPAPVLAWPSSGGALVVTRKKKQ